MIELPDWMDCATRHGNGEELNPLENFILDNEPAGRAEGADFRKGLVAALSYVLSGIRSNEHE